MTRKHAEVELEGGGWEWWYVCEECHGMVNYQQDICRNCGSILIWEPEKKKKIYTGEQTEPAE